ncbi:TonB-dependent receptor [Colwellia sp. MSW7]|uniref:TonB-dependent receptor n=1 Tax=Colwellia maritima TaxID=2912588 RepID=A0ABS9WZ11_9GAMM|nr:TonB-dependent receptor [Colwellia maritima]MCI2283204.1 TonB-dependent receptor [Colwellia maritima]
MKLNKISSIYRKSNNKKRNEILFGAALLSMLTMPTFAADEAISKAEAEIEVIQVTGMLSSLKAAALLKRTDDRIVDAIVAEDIGKLPDNNIAEALQRITGVSISRDFGVGNAVSIRGLPQNRVELNGRSTVGDDRNGVSFDDFPASFLKAVEVVKSPTPEMIEGALGGTISMKTIRPLELEKTIAAISLDAEYADKVENVAPVFSASVGTNWDLGDNGTFGIMGMVAYQDRELRRDEAFNRIKAYDHTSIEGIDTASANTPSGKYIIGDQNTIEEKTETRERTALNVSLQWAPASAQGNFYLDLSSTDRSGSQDAYSVLDGGSTFIATADTYEDSNGQLRNFQIDNVSASPKAWNEFRETKSISNAIGGEWYFTDKLLISGEYSIAKSESTKPKTEFNGRAINHDAFDEWADNWDGSSSLPGSATHTSLATIVGNGDNVWGITYADPDIFSDPDNLSFREYKYKHTKTDNEEKAIRLDVVYSEPAGLEWVSAVKAGVRTTTRDYEYNESAYNAKDLYNKMTKDGIPYAIWLDEVEAMHPGSTKVVNNGNTFDQTGFTGPNDILTYRVFDANQMSDAEGTFAKVQSMLSGTNYATTGSLASNLTYEESAYRDISEDTTAVYLQFNLDFDEVRAIVGGRYLNTEITSAAYQDGVIVSDTIDYNDFLPSLNVTWDFNDETLVRFAAAKVMRRADFGQLSPTFDYDNSFVNASRGNIALEPYRATQYDISVEHYFGAGNMVSAALFYKDVASFLTNETYCGYDAAALAEQNTAEFDNICIRPDATSETSSIVTTNDLDEFNALNAAGRTGINVSLETNGENGTVQGLELGYQQNFDFLPGALSGLGFLANYTYADSEQPNGNPLLDISKNTLNAQIYWEYEDVALRLAYTFRDKYLYSENEKRVVTIGSKVLDNSTSDSSDPEYDATTGNNYRDDASQLDFSASWNINENFTLVGNVTNLTAEPISFSTELGSKWKFSESDRRFTVGIRAKF